MIHDPIPIAAAVVSTVALLAFIWALRQPRNTRYLGPAADYWETLRSVLLPLLARRVPRIKWSYTLHEREAGAEQLRAKLPSGVWDDR